MKNDYKNNLNHSKSINSKKNNKKDTFTKKLSKKRKHIDNSVEKSIDIIKLDKNKEIIKLEELKIDDTLFKINDNA